MAKSIAIDLAEPLKGHGAPVKTITVAEPKGKDFYRLGDPYVVARNPDGTLFHVENDELVRAYIEACVDCDPLLLDQLTLGDAMAVKDAVLGFFTDARSSRTKPST